jgi:hypothetical protein
MVELPEAVFGAMPGLEPGTHVPVFADGRVEPGRDEINGAPK